MEVTAGANLASSSIGINPDQVANSTEMNVGEGQPVWPDGEGRKVSCIKSKAVKLKLIAMVHELLAFGFSVAALDNGIYFYQCNSTEDRDYRNGRLSKGPLDTGPFESCEDYVSYTYENCLLFRRHCENIKKNGGSCDDDEKLSCPSTWLVDLSTATLGITWVLSFIVLILMSVRKQKLERMNLFGNAISAAINFLSGVVLTTFIIWVFVFDYPCTQEEYDKEWTHNLADKYARSWTRDDSSKIESYQPRKFFDVDDDMVFETCLEQKHYVYKIWYLLVATLSIVVATICDGLAVLNRKRRVDPGPDAITAIMTDSVSKSPFLQHSTQSQLSVNT